jgi:hypothetical protein
MPEMIGLSKLHEDPSKRKTIIYFHPNQHEDIRRNYLMWGPHQPCPSKFKPIMIGKSKMHFIADWYDMHANRLEYNEAEDKAYFLCCYFFRDNIKGNEDEHDAFVREGYVNWKKVPERDLQNIWMTVIVSTTRHSKL